MATTNSLKIPNQLLRADKLDDALKEYERLIELRPNFAWNYYYLGQLLAKQSKWRDAVTQYREAIKLNPNSANFHNSLGEALIEQGEFDDAIHSSQKAISLEPNVTIYHQTLALAYEAKSDLLEAFKSWQKVLSINPNHLRATQKICWLQTDVAPDYISTGDKLSKEEKIKEAVDYYQQGLILNHQQPMSVYRSCGNNLITLGRFEEAETVFQQLKERFPEQPDGYERCAKLTHFWPDWELALKRWNEAVAKFPDNIGFQIQKGNVLINLSRFDEADAVFQGIKEKYPEQPHGYERAAKLTHFWPDWDLALERWNQAIAKFPHNIAYQVEKGNVLINLSRFDEAEAMFQGIKEKYPEQPHGYERAAKLTHFLLDWELALERWNQAIAKFPHNIAYQVEKGNVLINLSRFDEAEAVFQGVKQRFPEQPHGYDGYARVAHSWVDLELALERWSEAIAKFPDRINFQIYKGNVLIKLFRFDEADVVFQGIKQRFPEQPHGYDGYARVAHSWGDLELALERWEEAIAKLPNHFQFYLCKGDALINLFRYEEAETWFEEVVAKYPHRHEGLFQSASLARRLGNLELAKQKWELAIQHLPEQIPAYCEAARDLKALGRFAEAEEKFRQALQKSPNDLTALLQGGILASQQENRELALERFERIIEYHPPQKSIDAYILAATELKYLGRQDEAIAKYEQVLNFNRSPHLHLEVKLLGTSLTCIQELGLLLDRLVTKPPDSIKHIIYLARLTKQILCSGISRKPYSIGFVAQDAPSLLPKLKLLKKLFWQVLATQEDCKKWNLGIADFGYDLYLLAIAQLLNEKYLRLFSFYFHTLIQQWQQDLLVLKHLNIAIQLLEKESQRLNSSECERVKQVPSPIAPQLIDNLCFEDLSSSARYIIGRDELLESSKRKAATTFSPLMDEEKVFFEVPIRNFVSSLKLRSRQDIFIYKDVVWNAPFAFSQGYIIPHYGLKISDKFVNEFVDDNPSSAKEHVAKYDTFKYIIDPRPTLKEIPVSKKVLNTYYEDDVVFGLPVVGYIWGAYQNYGHLLLDQIPSLILYQKLNLSCKIFVPHITDSHWDILNALNIPKEQILVKPEHKFKHLIISVYRYEIEMLEFYRRLRCSIAANSSDKFPEYCLRKIYVSRRYSSYRHMANEIEVEELMKSLGFSIIYLERLSFEETALLMHHVSLVVAPFGASLGSFILCRARTTLVIIFPPDAYLLPDVYKILVLGEYQFYPLSGDKTVNGWQINTDKLEKVVTKLVEGQVKN